MVAIDVNWWLKTMTPLTMNKITSEVRFNASLETNDISTLDDTVYFLYMVLDFMGRPSCPRL